MKKIIVTTALIASLAINCFSQTNLNPVVHEDHAVANPLYILKVKGHPDIYLDGITTAYLSTIKQSSIQSMEVWKDSKSVEKFGEKGKNGVIQITLSDTTILATTDELFKKFNIKKRYRKLPVYVDNIQIPNPSKTFFEASTIKSITVTTYAGARQNIINIFTDNTR